MAATAHSERRLARRAGDLILRLTLVTVITATALAQLTGIISSDTAAAALRVTLVNLNGRFPVGTPNLDEPSGEGPPSRSALVGYRLAYVTDFDGTTVPRGWDVFTGIPTGDPGGHFGAAHTVVSGGMLELLTYRDPAFKDGWVTGGVCQCGTAREYGAYFVRSRVTGQGPNEAELLWPANGTWPPEVDFNETGGSIDSTTTSVHFGTDNTIVRSAVHINMTKWHTWGVIWTPTELVYTVDGRIWGTFKEPEDIPHERMTLDLEQRTICSEDRQCPRAPVDMDVDWIAEYVRI